MQPTLMVWSSQPQRRCQESPARQRMTAPVDESPSTWRQSTRRGFGESWGFLVVGNCQTQIFPSWCATNRRERAASKWRLVTGVVQNSAPGWMPGRTIVWKQAAVSRSQTCKTDRDHFYFQICTRKSSRQIITQSSPNQIKYIWLEPEKKILRIFYSWH